MEGHLVKVGRIDLWARPFLVIGGLLIAYPGWIYTGIGAALTLLVIVIIWLRRKTTGEKISNRLTSSTNRHTKLIASDNLR